MAFLFLVAVGVYVQPSYRVEGHRKSGVVLVGHDSFLSRPHGPARGQLPVIAKENALLADVGTLDENHRTLGKVYEILVPHVPLVL